MIVGAHKTPDSRRRCLILLCIAVMASLPAVIFWPMDALTVREDDGRIVLRAPMPPGCGFATRYIHSVQLSPVEDEFFVRNGVIRLWRSRFQGQNAGLPSLPPDRGRAYLDEPWIVYEGAIASFASYAQRVGNEKFGRNHLRIGQGPWQPLYMTLPDRRLHLAAGRCALYRL